MIWLLLTAFLAGALTVAALWRYIVLALYWLGMAIGTLFAWRIVSIVNGDQFTLSYARPIFIGAISALVVCILCSSYIRHALILFYLHDAIDKQKQAAQKGRLW